MRWMGCFCLFVALASGATAADDPTTGGDQRRNHALSVLREALQDDDFATWSTSSGELEQKMLDSNTIDRNRLYIVPADLAVK